MEEGDGGADLPPATETIPMARAGGGAAEAGEAREATTMTGHSLANSSVVIIVGGDYGERRVYVTNANRRDGNLLLSQ